MLLVRDLMKRTAYTFIYLQYYPSSALSGSIVVLPTIYLWLNKTLELWLLPRRYIALRVIAGAAIFSIFMAFLLGH